MMRIDLELQAEHLLPRISRLWEASAAKIVSIEASYPPGKGAPVFTVNGKYTARGWTEWTQGFQYGSAILQFDATNERRFLDIGRRKTIDTMASHVTHMGVHDHGFNNVSTYGNLRRLMLAGRFEENRGELRFYELALGASGAVQARRWTKTKDGGFIYSFNGPHSLFADTMRTLRSLALAHSLGHVLMDEQDTPVSLFARLVHHAQSTAWYNLYYGEGRDRYDVRGRVAHESIFNTNDGSYRCPSTQQGYSPFSTWTRGLAWVMLGFAEELEYLGIVSDTDLQPHGGRDALAALMLKAAEATCDFYIENTPTDGIPYWDTGAPGLDRLGDYLGRPADPFNEHEPVDSSAAAIAAQGLLRLGHYLVLKRQREEGKRYWQAGLTILQRLFDAPYLSTDPNHQGLILHSVYHRPNGWDYIPTGRKVPCGESGMWGDYHAREVALYVQRIALVDRYYTFFGLR